MNKRSRLRNLLDRYLNNSCTESEMQEFLNFLKRADNEPEIKKLLSEVWKQISDSEVSVEDDLAQNRDQWFEEIYSEARKRENPYTSKVPQKLIVKKPGLFAHNHNSSQWVKVAVILLFSVLFSFIYYTISDKEPEKSVVYKEKVAEPGEKVRFILSDGTQVHLNSGSRLEYPATFKGTTREVRLEGEAYFDVAHIDAHPFIVHTEKITTKVLGTSFDVRSYPGEDETLVAVAEGKVAVHESASGIAGSEEDNNGIVLEANQWTNYKSSEQTFTTETGDISRIIAWNKDVLFYENEELEEVAYQLERWYGVSINFADEDIKNCIIQGEHRKEALDNVLETITYAFVDMEYQINGRQVTLTGTGCK